MKSQEKSHLRSVVLRAIALFALIAVVSVVVIGLVSRTQISDRLEPILQSAHRVLELQSQIIRDVGANVSSDLLFLANQNELLSYLETNDRSHLDAVAREYMSLARQKARYNQIRFLDAHGMEIVRVDFNDGTPVVVADEFLQPKGTRYYFLQAIALDVGKIFVSQLDLNVEQGIIEEPRKPVIRFATPIRDRAGQLQGVIVLNYLGADLFSAIEHVIEGTDQKTFSTNEGGYWLWGPDPSVEWGFMYEGGDAFVVDTSFPGAWEYLSAAENGQFRLPSGLFTFTTIRPVNQTISIAALKGDQSASDALWKLISFVPASVLSTFETPIRRLWRITLGLSLLLAAGISWFYARFRVLRAEYRHRIEFLAKYDSLTGACNRHYFEQSIADEEARARRYKHSISFLMIDITRFKQINDTYGHQFGDEVLTEVTAILRGNVRETDVVVRYGGDEFLIMFPETPGEADAAKERILNAIDELNADKSKFDFPIMLALGSAHWEPASGESIEDALSHADERMYEHKQLQHEKLDGTRDR